MRAYDHLSEADKQMVIRIATAMGNGVLGTHNKTFPLMARRVFDELLVNDLLVRPLEAEVIPIQGRNAA